MKVTYIGHSGFLVETAEVYLLFDCVAPVGESGKTGLEYSTGTLPELDPAKDLVVFVSHKHGDHYERSIWKLRKIYPRVKYVIARDIPFSTRAREKLGILEEDMKDIFRPHADEEFILSSGGGAELKIETFLSTDEGLAFYVTVNGQTIYHAGDLHLWAWTEDGPAYVEEMTRQFYQVTERLKGRETDVAFLLLDPRLGETAYMGMDAYLKLMDVKYVFPMHFWKQYDFIADYIKARPGTPVQRIRREGQVFVF